MFDIFGRLGMVARNFLKLNMCKDSAEELPLIIPIPAGSRIKDMTGEKHGMLTCLGYVGLDKRGESIFKFKCECEKDVILTKGTVRSGNTKSCGCYGRKAKSKRSLKDMSGQTTKSGIKINHRVGSDKVGAATYNCTCYCGKEFVTLGCSLRSGNTKSCGCYKTSPEFVKSRANFIRDAIAVHGIYYDYSEVEYVNCRTKVKIICPKYGAFWQRPTDHLYGKGHPNRAMENKGSKGAQAKYFENEMQIIYQISFEACGTDVYKIGLTNNLDTAKKRMGRIKSNFKSSKPKILSMFHGDIKNCYRAEQFIKSKMKNCSIERPEGSPCGWTECFSKPIPEKLWREATKNLTEIKI